MGTLFLTRREGEGVVATLPNGDRIDITPVEIKGGTIRLRFEAPPSILLSRRELLRDETLPLTSIGPAGIGDPTSREVRA